MITLNHRYALVDAQHPLGKTYDIFLYVCHGCHELFGGGIQGVPVNTGIMTPTWTWDGNMVTPSIEEEIIVIYEDKICRKTLTNGIFRYHNDSTHRMSGYNMYPQPFPEWYQRNLALREVRAYN